MDSVRGTAAPQWDSSAHVIWLEAESFADYGGWVHDSQFIDVMGSPYLMAHGLGRPVADAVTTVSVAQAGQYRQGKYGEQIEAIWRAQDGDGENIAQPAIWQR